MKKLAVAVLAAAFTLPIIAQEPAQTDQPKAEKTAKKKTNKKRTHKKVNKKKAEEPKAQ